MAAVEEKPQPWGLTERLTSFLRTFPRRSLRGKIAICLFASYLAAVCMFNVQRSITTRNIFDELGYATLDKASQVVWFYPESIGMSRMYLLNPFKQPLAEKEWFAPVYLDAARSMAGGDPNDHFLPFIFPFGYTLDLPIEMERCFCCYGIPTEEGPSSSPQSNPKTMVDWEPFLRDWDAESSTLSWHDGVTLRHLKISAVVCLPRSDPENPAETRQVNLRLSGSYDPDAQILTIEVCRPQLMGEDESLDAAQEFFEGFVMPLLCDATNSFRFSAENPGDVTITYKLRGDSD